MEKVKSSNQPDDGQETLKIYLQGDQDAVACAGVRHLTALGRSARLGADSDLGRLMQGGWAASVSVTQCDAAFSEDMRAVLAPNRRLGKVLSWVALVQMLTRRWYLLHCQELPFLYTQVFNSYGWTGTSGAQKVWL